MDYRVGGVGRVFMIRFDHGEDFLAGIRDLARLENIRQGWFQMLGGMLAADVVTGPRQPTMPPEPVWREERTVRELLGSGTVFWEGDEPRLHMHAAMGHHGDTLTACVRKGTKTYLVLEVMLLELVGFDAQRPFWPEGGFNRLCFV